MGTYASYADVQARIPGRSISATTKPSSTQVDAWVEEAEAMILGSLGAAGITAPASSLTNPGKIVRAWVCDYAEGMTRMAYASAGGDGANQDGKDLRESFRALTVNIRRSPQDYGAMLSAGSIGTEKSFCRGANVDTTADDYLAPEFERDPDDQSGAF